MPGLSFPAEQSLIGGNERTVKTSLKRLARLMGVALVPVLVILLPTTAIAGTSAPKAGLGFAATPLVALAGPSGGDPCIATGGYWRLDDVQTNSEAFWDVYNDTTNYYYVALEHYGCAGVYLYEYVRSIQYFGINTYAYTHTVVNVTVTCFLYGAQTQSWSSDSVGSGEVSSAAYSVDAAANCEAGGTNNGTNVWLPDNGSGLSLTVKEGSGV
jgi:hypothetical protein